MSQDIIILFMLINFEKLPPILKPLCWNKVLWQSKKKKAKIPAKFLSSVFRDYMSGFTIQGGIVVVQSYYTKEVKHALQSAHKPQAPATFHIESTFSVISPDFILIMSLHHWWTYSLVLFFKVINELNITNI